VWYEPSKSVEGEQEMNVGDKIRIINARSAYYNDVFTLVSMDKNRYRFANEKDSFHMDKTQKKGYVRLERGAE
jgi:hypothetical protein